MMSQISKMITDLQSQVEKRDKMILDLKDQIYKNIEEKQKTVDENYDK